MCIFLKCYINTFYLIDVTVL